MSILFSLHSGFKLSRDNGLQQKANKGLFNLYSIALAWRGGVSELFNFFIDPLWD